MSVVKRSDELKSKPVRGKNIQVRAANHWTGLLGGLKFPSCYKQVRQVVVRDDKVVQPALRLEKRLNEPLWIFLALFSCDLRENSQLQFSTFAGFKHAILLANTTFGRKWKYSCLNPVTPHHFCSKTSVKAQERCAPVSLGTEKGMLKAFLNGFCGTKISTTNWSNKSSISVQPPGCLTHFSLTIPCQYIGHFKFKVKLKEPMASCWLFCIPSAFVAEMIHKLRFTWPLSPPEAIMNILAQF